jgi:hypothetical protein
MTILAYSKKGATAAPFFIGGRMAYRFLPPFFFPPLAVFFAITLIPPFTLGSLRWALLQLQRRCLPARQPASVSALASLQNSRTAGGKQPKKWGCHRSTPPDR